MREIGVPRTASLTFVYRVDPYFGNYIGTKWAMRGMLDVSLVFGISSALQSLTLFDANDLLSLQEFLKVSMERSRLWGYAAFASNLDIPAPPPSSPSAEST